MVKLADPVAEIDADSDTLGVPDSLFDELADGDVEGVSDADGETDEDGVCDSV